jgi:hypothetical protein
METPMNLCNITVTTPCGKKISSIMFAGDFTDLVEKTRKVESQYPDKITEGFIRVLGGGWQKILTKPATLRELR